MIRNNRILWDDFHCDVKSFMTFTWLQLDAVKIDKFTFTLTFTHDTM
jgi:hypothetical protein